MSKIFKKVGKVAKKAVPALVGGGLGFLTGGPAGAALGAAGGLFGGKKFTQGEEAGVQAGVTDVRTPAERALDEARSGYYLQRMGEKDLGYQAESLAESEYWKSEEDRLKQAVSGAAAERGFGTLRHGPSLAAETAGLQAMGAERARYNIGRRQDYMQNILRGPGAPTGRSAYAMMRPGQESGLAAMAGPAVGEFMKGQGGQMGARLGQIGGYAKRLFGRRGPSVPNLSPSTFAAAPMPSFR